MTALNAISCRDIVVGDRIVVTRPVEVFGLEIIQIDPITEGVYVQGYRCAAVSPHIRTVDSPLVWRFLSDTAAIERVVTSS